MKRSKLLTIPRAAARLLPAPTHLRRLFVALVVLLTMTAQTAWATETSTITVGGTDYTLFTGFTATGGNGTNYANLVDGNTSTDWIATKSFGEATNHFNGGTGKDIRDCLRQRRQQLPPRRSGFREQWSGHCLTSG